MRLQFCAFPVDIVVPRNCGVGLFLIDVPIAHRILCTSFCFSISVSLHRSGSLVSNETVLLVLEDNGEDDDANAAANNPYAPGR